MQLEVCGNWIFGEGIRFEIEYPALEAVFINGRVLVTFDWMAFERNAPAQNLFCYDSSGNLLWRAPTIGMGAVDAFTGVTNEEPLWVGNFSGFNCRIDETSGQVLETCFTKQTLPASPKTVKRAPIRVTAARQCTQQNCLSSALRLLINSS